MQQPASCIVPSALPFDMGKNTDYHSTLACSVSTSTPVTVSAWAGELRAQTCAIQLTRPCLAGLWPRQTTTVPPHVRRLQCSASRQMAAEQDTTTALTALLVDRVPCLSARPLPAPLSSPLSLLIPSRLVPASLVVMLHAVCESTRRHAVLLQGLLTGHPLFAWALVQDNYAWLLREESGKVAIVDPSEAQPVIQALESRYVLCIWFPC